MCRKSTYLSSVILVLGVATSTVVADLVAYYPLDEGTGTTTADASGNGHDGTLNNGVTWVLPGYVGNSAINVDGNAGSRVAIGTWDPSEGTGQLSLALWVKWSGEQDKSDHQGLIGKRDSWAASGALRWFLEVRNNGRIHLRNYSQGVAAPAGTLDPFVNQWAHIAVTFDGTTARIYLNGVEQASGDFSLHDKTNAAMGIGCTHGGSNTNQEVFSGDLDEVYIYNNALSETEIQNLAQGVLPTFPKARAPQPEDGATQENAWASLSWKQGDSAASHNVYFGDNFGDVSNGTGGTFQGNQPSALFLVGLPEYPYPDGLTIGTTYYWRVDEVEADGTTIHKGDVWSFFIPPKKAYRPDPADGANLVETGATMSWEAGFGTKLHYVYFGDNYADVEAGTGGTAKGPTTGTSFAPGPLELAKTYYWRVDEFDGTMHTGNIWSFTTTLPGLGTVVHDRWENISGGSIDNLTNDPRYPDLPDATEQLTEFSWDGPDIDNYGGRIHGWLHVPLTGDYTFWLTSDNDSELWLSTNDDPENVELVASLSGWAGANEWTKFPSQKSDPVSLTAGNKYYIMALWKEGSGGDHCRVGWEGPGISTRTIIPGSNLSRYEPVKAYGPSPADGATDAKRSPILTWKPGQYVASHKVYFSDNLAEVEDGTALKASQADTSYGPVGPLELSETYYWRVDEVNSLNPDSPWIGDVWNFTVADYLVVDDFEDYGGDEVPLQEQIWFSWHDGLGYGTQDTPPYYAGNGTGAEVGDGSTASYTEEVIVNNGAQSMPYWYNNNKQGYFKYSEAQMVLSAGMRDWSTEGTKALSLWFRGYPASSGSFTEAPVGTYTMNGSGADITGPSDEFHYAYKTLSGVGSIVARVESVQNTHAWAKAGVMIRETLDPDSAHAMAFVTPGQGAVFEYRPGVGQNNVGAAGQQAGVAAPYWVKIERDISGTFTASHSTDGSTWQTLGTPANIQMSANLYIGLAVTAHNAAATCQAVFSSVTIVGSAGPQWMHQDIGIQVNDPEPMYVAVANSTGAPAVVYHDDLAAARIDTWTEWNIDLKDFADQGVNLADVDSVAIGFGDRNNPQAGGAGKMYFDDIRLYRPRCVPDKVTLSAADLNSDCVVDMADVEIMAGDWLTVDPALAADLNADSSVDFRDYAALADQWLNEQLWPEW